MSKLTPPLWVTEHTKLTKHLTKNWLRFIRRAGTQKWKYHLRCLTHQHTFPSTPKLCSPSRPSLRPGGSALCLQAKAKSLPGNPAQQPVGIIRDGWHLASMARCGPQRWPQSQPTVTATLLLQQISNRACTLPDIFSSQTHPHFLSYILQ